jgi:transposase
MRKSYSSDISRDQFDLISGILGEVKVETKKREVDLYDVYCAILYRLKNGCTWENLPHDFPPVCRQAGHTARCTTITAGGGV